MFNIGNLTLFRFRVKNLKTVFDLVVKFVKRKYTNHKKNFVDFSKTRRKLFQHCSRYVSFYKFFRSFAENYLTRLASLLTVNNKNFEKDQNTSEIAYNVATYANLDFSPKNELRENPDVRLVDKKVYDKYRKVRANELVLLYTSKLGNLPLDHVVIRKLYFMTTYLKEDILNDEKKLADFLIENLNL